MSFARLAVTIVAQTTQFRRREAEEAMSSPVMRQRSRRDLGGVDPTGGRSLQTGQ